MRALLPLLVCAALALAGCGSRERANPFDPLNPATSGRPAGFLALAGDRDVTLRWSPVAGGEFTGYQVFRRGPGETGFTALTGVLSPLITSFRDVPLVNGADYAYRLYFVFLSGLGLHPAEDTATPGAAMPWIIEGAGSDLVRLTPDNRHVAQRRGGNEGSVDVAADPTNGDVWVADQGSGRVVIHQAGAGVTVTVPGFNQPVSVTVDAFNASGWICDVGRGRVYHLRRDGQLEATSLGPLNRPVDTAVDPFNGFVWVCEFDGDRVLYYDDTAQSLWSATVPGPSRVAVDSTTREGWVTSFDQGTVTRISPAGAVLGTLHGFIAPLGVAVDTRRGLIWIADPYAGRVTALDRNGQEEFRVTGLDDAGELSVDPGTGEVWVALGAGGRVARISAAGVVLREQRGFRTPISISVDPGGR
jgi:DNA-binding beta-propeller fold protein YncE